MAVSFSAHFFSALDLQYKTFQSVISVVLGGCAEVGPADSFFFLIQALLCAACLCIFALLK
jgi:hypothetical protein